MVMHPPAQDGLGPALTDILSSRRAIWIGAASFEERCIASLSALSTTEQRLHGGIMFRYRSIVHPIHEANLRTSANERYLANVIRDISVREPITHDIEPHTFDSVIRVLDEAIASFFPELLIIDLSCMTRIHVLAVASWLSLLHTDLSWLVTYTIPENYGNLVSGTKFSFWRDVIVAPLNETATLLYENQSRGVIITGHDADRLVLALSELEPAGGVVVIPNTADRPDLRRLNERMNRRVLRQLTNAQWSDWVVRSCDVMDIPHLCDLVNQEVRVAKEHDSPVVLFPFGPKPLVFFAARQLCLHYPNASWFVYPVASSYNVDYSEGIASTVWFVSD